MAWFHSCLLIVLFVMTASIIVVEGGDVDKYYSCKVDKECKEGLFCRAFLFPFATKYLNVCHDGKTPNNIDDNHR